MREEIAYNKGYRVSNDGILTNPKGVYLSGTKTRDGYTQFVILHNGRRMNLHIHRLQAYQKYGERIYEPGMQVRHLNGNPSDNSWKNIGIGTHSENMLDIPYEVRLHKAKHASSFNIKYDANAVNLYYQENGFMKTLRHFNMSSKGTLHAVLKRYQTALVFGGTK